MWEKRQKYMVESHKPQLTV